MGGFNGFCAEPASKTQAFDVRPGISSQAVFIWISIGCTVVVCLSMGALALTHMMNYTIPREQRLLLRIIFLPPIFTVCNLISTIFYPSAVYLNQFPKIVEAIGLAAVFELYVFYLTPGATPDQRDYYFETLDRKHVKVPLFCCFSKRHTKTKHDRGSLRWFKISWALVFQEVLMSWLLAIVQWVAAAKLCPYDKPAQHVNRVIQILSAFFVVIAIFTVLAFETRMSEPLRPLGPKRKLWGMKLFVFTSVIFFIVIAILVQFDHIAQKTPRLNYYDLTVGVPDVLFELSMLIFCGVFWWAYPATRYRRAVTTPDTTGAILPRQPAYRALFDTLNITDVFKGVWTAVKVLAFLPFGKKKLGYHAAGGAGMGGKYEMERKPVSEMPEVGERQV